MKGGLGSTKYVYKKPLGTISFTLCHFLLCVKSHQRMAISNDNGKDDDASAAVPSLQRRAAVRTGFGFKRQEGEMDCVLFISKGKKGECQTPNMSGRGLCSCLKCFFNTSQAQLEMESVSSFLQNNSAPV